MSGKVYLGRFASIPALATASYELDEVEINQFTFGDAVQGTGSGDPQQTKTL